MLQDLLVITNTTIVDRIAGHSLMDDNGAPADGTAWILPTFDLTPKKIAEIIDADAGYLVRGYTVHRYDGSPEMRKYLAETFESGGWCGFTSRQQAYGWKREDNAIIDKR
jgi:hypothetical protein